MKIEATSPENHIEQLPEDRQAPMQHLRQVILDHLPTGFQETMSYNMIGYVVPHNIFPAGYHCAPQLPLPFLNIASQKNFIALYHMGLYASPPLLEWFVAEYPRHSARKLDMGKSCIRFKKMEDIPFGLIGELVGKMSVSEWVGIYETLYKR